MMNKIPIAGIAAALGLSLLICAAVSAQDTSIISLDGYQAPPIVQAPAAEAALITEPSMPPALQYEVMDTPTASCQSCETGEAKSADKKCGCALCQKKKAGKPSPCAGSHKNLFYENNFSYLSKKDNTAHCLGDSFKDRPVGKCGKLSIGGQMRWRYMNETGMAQQAGATRFQDTFNQFGLARLRLYADWKVNNNIRFYAEGIYADVIRGTDEYIARGIDVNRGDFQNLFADFNLDDRTTVRLGRQELNYGAQRLVSALDWANTRRRFDGVKTISKFDKFNIDTWYTQFVPVQPGNFDNPDEDRHFWGAWATLTQLENKTLDMYYLGLNDNRGPTGIEAVHTFGSRLLGNTEKKLLYEFQGNVQSGSRDLTDVDLAAWALTGGLGYKFAERSWKPTLWFYYDYATGDDPTTGNFTRFNDLFPLGHKYLGFIDAVQRRNVLSPNVRLTATPTDKLSLLLWYYNFRTAESQDNILSLGGTPAQDPSSSDFGNEIDFVATYKVNARNTALVGYSHFFRGDRIIGDTDADFLYLQWATNF